jgi:hypothetical protein
VVVELAAVVALQCTDRAPELGGYPGEEVSECGKRVGLQSKGESPKKMGVVVQNDQIVFVAGEAKDRRRPEQPLTVKEHEVPRVTNPHKVKFATSSRTKRIGESR